MDRRADAHEYARSIADCGDPGGELRRALRRCGVEDAAEGAPSLGIELFDCHTPLIRCERVIAEIMRFRKSLQNLSRLIDPRQTRCRIDGAIC